MYIQEAPHRGQVHSGHGGGEPFLSVTVVTSDRRRHATYVYIPSAASAHRTCRGVNLRTADRVLRSNSIPTSMDNVTANTSRSATEDVSAIIGTTTADGVLLLVVFIASVTNLLTIAALIGKDNSELVRSIRVILVNLLAACVLGALAAALYHISSPILRLSSSAAAHGPALCHTSAFLITTSSSGRILFTTFYGVAVFIVVYFWNRPVLAPRNTKYFIIASAVMWLLAVATGIPSLAEESVRFCGISSSNITGDRENTSWSSRFILHVTLPYIIVPSFAVIVTPAMLIKTSCYIRRKGIGTQRDTKKALVKFGLFLMIVQGINVFSQVVVPLVALGISTLQMNLSLFYIIAIAVADLSLIPTSVLITVFFKPVRVRVHRWICCFRHEQAARSRPGT